MAMTETLPIQFTATTERGAGRGKDLGAPTINLSPSAVPDSLIHGVYAGRARIDDAWHAAAIHYGPAPVFSMPETFEVHILDHDIPVAPDTLDVECTTYLRPIQDFPSVDALAAQIADDIKKTRAIMKSNETHTEEHHQ